MSKALRRRLRHQLLRLASRGSVRLPSSFVRQGLRGAAWLSRFSSFEQRTLSNLELAFGDELELRERRAICAGVRRHSARMTHEWLQLSGMRGDLSSWIEERVELDDSLEILRAAKARGRGVIVVTAHLGNWELLAATLKRVGLDGAVVGLEKHRDPTGDWLVAMRRNYGVETIPQHTHPRALLRVLQKNQLLGLLCDLEVRRLAGRHISFFGRPALTMTAPAALARARGLPLIPVRCVLPHEGAARYRLMVEPPLQLSTSLGRGPASEDLMARVNGVFEGWIREHPMQWAWHQHRWRTPPGELNAIPLAGRSPMGLGNSAL